VTIDTQQALMFAFGALAVLAIVFLILWLTTAAGRRKQSRLRLEAEREHVELRLSLDEQTARLRIVRELHEVAIHSVTVMISQADGAKYTAEQDPAAAVRAIAVIAEVARNTLADLRRVMTVVHEGEVDVAPQLRVNSEQDLFEIMRSAGLEIEFEETGERFDLREGAELAIYSILQEALANALEFGGEGTQVHVTYNWTDEGLQLKVDDDGVRASSRREGLDPNRVARQRVYSVDDDLDALTEAATGPGITEMRERAALFGGVFSATSVPGVGFSISAVFPTLKYHNGIHGVNLDEAQR
jgi:signal transduction histidine kinase